MKIRFLVLFAVMALLSACYTTGRFSITVRDANTGQPVNVDRIEVKKGQNNAKLEGQAASASEYMTDKLRYGVYYIAVQDKTLVLSGETHRLERKIQPVEIYVTKPRLELEIVDKESRQQLAGATVTLYDQYGGQLDRFSYPSKSSLDQPEGRYALKIECPGYEIWEGHSYLSLEDVNTFELSLSRPRVISVTFLLLNDKPGKEITGSAEIEVSGGREPLRISYPANKSLEMELGSYKVKVSGHKDYKDYSGALDLSQWQAETKEHTITLIRKPPTIINGPDPIIKVPPVTYREFSPNAKDEYVLTGSDQRAILNIQIILNDGQSRDHSLALGKAQHGSAEELTRISIQGILKRYNYNASNVKKIVVQ